MSDTFSFPRVSVPGLSMQESPLSGAAAGACESTGSAGGSSGGSSGGGASSSCDAMSPTTSVSGSKPWMCHEDTAAQWQAFSEHIAADGNQDYGDNLSESSDSVRTDPMNMYDTVHEQSSARDDVSVCDLVDSSPVSHGASGVSPGLESPDQVSLCQPRPVTPECSSDNSENLTFTESPDVVPLRQPHRDVGLSPMTQPSLPSALQRAVRDAVVNNPSVFEHYAAYAPGVPSLDASHESAVPVSSMFAPSQNAPIVAAPPRPGDWFESSSSPDIYWPPFSPPDTPDSVSATAGGPAISDFKTRLRLKVCAA